MSTEKILETVKEKELNFINYGNIKFVDNEIKSMTPSGLLIFKRFVSVEEIDKKLCWAYENFLKLDEIDILKYPLEEVRLFQKRDFNIDCEENRTDQYIRLFFDENTIDSFISSEDLFNFHLDHFGTFFEKIRSMYLCGANAEYTKKDFNIHKLAASNSFEILVVCDKLDSENKIIGFIVKDQDCDFDDFPNFYFVNDEVCGEYLLDFLKGISFEPIDGGAVYNVRDIFKFSDDEFKLLVSEFSLKNYLSGHGIWLSKIQINNILDDTKNDSELIGE